MRMEALGWEHADRSLGMGAWGREQFFGYILFSKKNWSNDSFFILVCKHVEGSYHLFHNPFTE